MSFEDRERRSALRTVAALSSQVVEEVGEVSAALSALHAEAWRVSSARSETEAVEVGELLIRFGRAQAALERQVRAAATMGDLLLGLSVSVPAVETDDA